MTDQALKRERLIALARDFICGLLSDGSVYSNREIIGIVMGDTAPGVDVVRAYHRTPFFEALTQLVEEGQVEYWRGDTLHYYRLIDHKKAADEAAALSIELVDEDR